MFNDPVKLFSTVFLFIIACACVCVAAYDLIVGHAIPPEVYSLLSAGVGAAIHVLGVQNGVNLANNTMITQGVTNGQATTSSSK